MGLNSFIFQVWDKKISYQLHNWIGLNAKNYEAYQKASGLKEQLEILEQVLTGNILSMAKGLGWEIDKQLEVSIQKINQTKPIRHKGTQSMSFNLAFETNVALPNYIGVGKSVSHGFGVIKKKNN